MKTMNKKGLAFTAVVLLLAAVLFVGAAAGADVPTESWGDTANQDITWYTANPEAVEFYLNDEEDFAGFAALVNGHSSDGTLSALDFSGKKIYLNADLDLTGKAWVPIGQDVYSSHNSDYSPNNWFAGTFDGKNHVISYRLDEETSFYYYDALFGYICDATIENLTINLEANYPTGVYVYDVASNADIYGAPAGLAAETAYSTIRNVELNGNFVLGSYATQGGSLIGVAFEHTIVDRCISNQHVFIKQYYRSASSSAYFICGGIISQTNGGVHPPEPPEIVITNCINNAVIQMEDPFDNDRITSTDSGGLDRPELSGTGFSRKLNSTGMIGQISGGSDWAHTVHIVNSVNNGQIEGGHIEKFTSGSWVSTIQTGKGSFIGKEWVYDSGSQKGKLIDYTIDVTIDVTKENNAAFYPNDNVYYFTEIPADFSQLTVQGENCYYRPGGWNDVKIVKKTSKGELDVTAEELQNLKYVKTLAGPVVYGSVIVVSKTAPGTYEVILPSGPDVQHVEVMTDKIAAVPDEVVTITVIPDTGYTVTSVMVNGTAAAAAEDNKFTFSMPAEKAVISVTVILQPTTATVTFDTQGHGTAPASQTVDIGGKVTRPADPTAWGFKFVDWYTDSGYTTLWNFDTDTVTGDMTLYAKWDSVFYIAKMPGYTYGAAELPSPFVEPAGLPDVSYVYSTSATDTAVPWVNITTTTLDAGTWYIGAISSDEFAKIRRSAFIVEKAPRDAPVFTVDPSTATVTITDYDANETYRYMTTERYANAADGWKTAPGQSFTLSGLKAGTDYELTMKIAESRNYKESYSASQDFTTPGYYTVNYYANGGVGSIASQTAQQGTDVTVKSPYGSISRVGYEFAGWKESNGTSHDVGAPVYDGMDLYAQWTAKQYTIIFDAKGGTVTPASKMYTYTEEVTLPVAEMTGSVFSGWAVTDGSPAVYTGNQKVQGLAESGTVTLYAVWTEEKHTITANIINPPAGKTITVRLMRGNAQIGKTVTVSDGTQDFANLPAGTYNLVAEALDGTTVVRTVTSAVILDVGNKSVDITFPAENVDSKVDVRNTENTPAVVVGNLDKEAETKAEGDTKVTVTLTVEAVAEKAKEDTMTPEEVQVQDSIISIKKEVPAAVAKNPLLFLEISVNKQKEGEDKPEPIRKTSAVIELLVPYDFTGKESTKVYVYRVHDGEYKPLKNESSGLDGTYQVNTSKGLIYIYTQLFSTYSVGYETESSKPSSGSTSSGTSVWATPTQTPGTPATEPTPGQTPGAADVPGVKPIQTPSGTSAKTPAPFVGVLAGLGAAAAVFGLRRK